MPARDPSTVCLKVLVESPKHLLYASVAWGYIDTSPAEVITQLRERSEPADFLSKEEARKLLS
tara:strand:- start:641 stop:829 length:189 start_codon:yes stop_codon:yes gene_type:complete